MEEAYKYLLNDLGICNGDTLAIACSGGADSMALLYLLRKLKTELEIDVVCAQVNHNTGRPGQAEEQLFVKEYCETNGIIFEGMTIMNYGNDNFHNEARIKRYNYFDEIARKYRVKYFFTAHHGDDLMETVLMRVVRGSTLKGYGGFSQIVDEGKYKIVRPFIKVTKSEILEFDIENKILFMEDSSNSKDKYTRNRYRKYIIPELRKEDPFVHQKFYKFSKMLLEYNDYIEKQTKKELKKVYDNGVLMIPLFLKLDILIQQKIICLILEEKYSNDLSLITDHHTQILLQTLNSNKPNLSVQLPNNLVAIKSYDQLTFTENKVENIEYNLKIQKHTVIPNEKHIEIIDKTDQTDNNICRLNSCEISMPLYARSKKNGDKIEIKGLNGSKKIKDIFINSKIPLKSRKSWPIVTDSKDCIVWIPGLKKSKFDKKINDKYDIILRYY